jgi:PEGA domain
VPTEPALKLHSTPDPEPDALGDLDLYAAERVQDDGGNAALVTRDLLDVVTNPEPLTLSGAARTVELQETPLPGSLSAGPRPASAVTQLFGRDERDLPERPPEKQPDRTPLWPVAVALMVGIALGFGGGYTLGGRRMGPAVPAPAVIAPPGREWTEGAVNDTSSRSGAAVQPEPAATVHPGTAGRLLVQSAPAGARVFVDGLERGRTPVTVLDLPRGPHRLRLARAGYADEERRIVVTAARSTPSVTVELKRPAVAPAAARTPAPPRPATPDTITETALSVDSRPGGARVFIDGKLVGATPISVRRVGAGAHAIRLERDGYRRWSSSIRMVAGEPNRVTASLDK